MTWREALVLDFGIFGSDWNEYTHTQLSRIRRKNRWLDSRGHLIMDAIYERNDADVDDATHTPDTCFASSGPGSSRLAWVTPRTTKSGGACFPVSTQSAVSPTSAPSSWRGRTTTSCAPRTWRGSTTAARKAGSAATSCQRIYLSVARLPGAESVAYSAVGPRLREILGGREGGRH